MMVIQGPKQDHLFNSTLILPMALFHMDYRRIPTLKSNLAFIQRGKFVLKIEIFSSCVPPFLSNSEAHTHGSKVRREKDNMWSVIHD